MTIRFATQDEIADWNRFILTNPDGGNVFQAKEFSEVKKANHWTPRFIVVNNLYISVLERKISLIGSFWYVPKGPGIITVKELKTLILELKKFAKDHGVFVVKLEPELVKTEVITNNLKKLGLSLSKGVQAANTVILDISPSIDDIVANFSPKTRYNIRAAKKAGVTTVVVPITNETCDLFYNMFAETIRGRSHLRSREYLKMYWQLHYNAGTGVFLFAKINGDIVSTDFITILGNKATRKDAASVRKRVVRGASALLEVNAIEYLKDRGVIEYDLFGTPPSDQIKNQAHPYYGFGTFKAGFNSHITDYIGSCDLIIKPRAYRFWKKIGERIIHKLYYYQHHDLYY